MERWNQFGKKSAAETEWNSNSCRFVQAYHPPQPLCHLTWFPSRAASLPAVSCCLIRKLQRAVPSLDLSVRFLLLPRGSNISEGLLLFCCPYQMYQARRPSGSSSFMSVSMASFRSGRKQPRRARIVNSFFNSGSGMPVHLPGSRYASACLDGFALSVYLPAVCSKRSRQSAVCCAVLAPLDVHVGQQLGRRNALSRLPMIGKGLPLKLG